MNFRTHSSSGPSGLLRPEMYFQAMIQNLFRSKAVRAPKWFMIAGHDTQVWGV